MKDGRKVTKDGQARLLREQQAKGDPAATTSRCGSLLAPRKASRARLGNQKKTVDPYFVYSLKGAPHGAPYLFCLHKTDIRQVPVLFRIIDSVTDHELVRNLKPDIIRIQCDEAAGRFIE